MLGLDGQKLLSWARRERGLASQEQRARLLAKELQSHEITVQPDNGRDISDALAQMGKPLSADEVIKRLKKCNRGLIFERSINFPSLFGIYVLREGKKHHICGMEAGMMPEFTVIHKTRIKVPDPEAVGKNVGRELRWKEQDTYQDQTRGWRTVLVRLLHAELITRHDVEKNFGWAPSRDSQRWHEQTR